MKKLLLFLAILFSVNVYAADLESEPNNDIKDADPVSPGIVLDGHFFDSLFGDDDWYYFDTSSENDILTVTLETSTLVGVDVYNSDFKLIFHKLLQMDPISGRANTGRIGLGMSGRYFVKLHGNHNYDYQLTTNLENNSSSNVPNNTVPETGTVSPNLDIHMPSLNYQSLTGIQNIWADLEYLGTNSQGKHIWGLKNFGANQK